MISWLVWGSTFHPSVLPFNIKHGFVLFQSLITTVLLLCDHSDITRDGRRLVSHQRVHVLPVTTLMTHLANCLFSQRSHANGMKPTPVLHVNVDNVAMPVSLQTFNEVRQLSVTLLWNSNAKLVICLYVLCMFLFSFWAPSNNALSCRRSFYISRQTLFL